MTKIKLNQLPLPREVAAKTIEIGDVSIEIKPQIPYEEVFDMIQWSINYIVADHTFISYPVYEIITKLAILKHYTNLDLDFIDGIQDPQELYSTYDIIAANFLDRIDKYIYEDQLKFYYNTLEKTIQSIIAYRNSAAGIVQHMNLEGMSTGANLEQAIGSLENAKDLENVKRLFDFMAEGGTFSGEQ